MTPCFLPRTVLLSGLIAAFASLPIANIHAVTSIDSPYVTTQEDIPLNQSTDDDINGRIPFGSHFPPEGASVESLSDATTADSPTANVIPGPDDTWVGVTWDFGGTPEEIANRRLDRIEIWIDAHEDLRKGYRGDFSVSLSGEVDDFTIIQNSQHWAELSQNDGYNFVRYDFPATFIAGEETDQDQHVVTNFRYLRFNTRGDVLGDTAEADGTSWQPRYVEIDVWTSEAPQSGTSFSLTPLPLSPEGHFRMRLNGGESWAEYALQASDDLVDWTEIELGWANDDGVYEFTDTNAPDFSRRFYRAEKK